MEEIQDILLILYTDIPGSPCAVPRAFSTPPPSLFHNYKFSPNISIYWLQAKYLQSGGYVYNESHAEFRQRASDLGSTPS